MIIRDGTPTRKGGAPIGVAHCWAHARRKLKKVFDRDGSEIAAEGLRRIAEFYAVEADIRGVSPDQRLSARQTRSAPLVAAFGDWLQAQRRKISSKSRLGEKLTVARQPICPGATTTLAGLEADGVGVV